jgi:broad specificity phosphatase PhoE
MTTLYLARHGQDLDNAARILNGRRDQPLTAIGLAQAYELAQKIKVAGIRFDKVYSSPLHRAFETAKTITSTLALAPPETMELLIERDFGMMTGLPASEITLRCAPDLLETDSITYFLSPEGAETFPQLLERAARLLEFLRNTYPEQTLLLVSHGDFGKMLYAAFYGLAWQEVLSSFHFGNSELLLLKEGSEPEKRQVFRAPQFNQ